MNAGALEHPEAAMAIEKFACGEGGGFGKRMGANMADSQVRQAIQMI